MVTIGVSVGSGAIVAILTSAWMSQWLHLNARSRTAWPLAPLRRRSLWPYPNISEEFRALLRSLYFSPTCRNVGRPVGGEGFRHHGRNCPRRIVRHQLAYCRNRQSVRVRLRFRNDCLHSDGSHGNHYALCRAAPDSLDFMRGDTMFQLSGIGGGRGAIPPLILDPRFREIHLNLQIHVRRRSFYPFIFVPISSFAPYEIS